MINLDRQIQLYSAKQSEYPYVVAYGRECLTSRGSILVFTQFGNAIVGAQEMNRIETEHNGRFGKQWEVKRLPIQNIKHSMIFYEELLQNKQLPKVRDYRNVRMIWQK